MARKKVSDREYINSAGDVVDRIEQATGGRYSLGKANGEDFDVTKDWDLQCGAPGTPVTMLAILGFHTKLGNVANTVLNDKENPGTVESAAQAIDEFLALMEKGTWAERVGGGGGGLRYNPDHMAAAIAEAKGENDPAPYLAKMSTRVDAKGQVVSANAAGEWPKGAISYAAFAARNAKVKAIYDRLAGTGVDLGAL